MLKVLSVQSSALGHRTYCNSLRECFSQYKDVALSAYWANEERSVSTRLITRGASLSIPLVSRIGSNLDLRRARAEWAYGRMSKLLAQRKMGKERYDLLHLHTQIQAFGCERLMKVQPTVVSLDMTAYQAAREPMVTHPKTFAINIQMEQKAFQAAAHIVTWSDWARQSVIEDHGVPANKVSTIAPGARLEHFQKPSFDIRAKPRILFVGGDFARKGGWDLLHVFGEHFHDQAELHLVTNQAIPTLPPNVFLHPNVAAYTSQWHELFRSSNILVLPSYAEAFGLVLQEAAGYGLALIGSRVGAIPEIISENNNGFLIEPGDRSKLAAAMATLLENRALLMHMCLQSRQLALTKFDAVTNFRKLADLFLMIGGETRMLA